MAKRRRTDRDSTTVAIASGRTTRELERDPDAVLRFIEHFASLMTDAGVPRMPARVFVALLASDPGRLTASELADRLRISPAAVSGAVRYLAQVGLITRERDPGSRRDYYRVHEHTWFEALTRRDELLARWAASIRQGLPAIGARTPAGRRLTETVEFFEFLQQELPALLARWRRARDRQAAS